MATKKTVESPEFLYLPLGSIIVEEQVRTGIDTTSESFKALMLSIKDKGVLEPVLVTQRDDRYLLLCGERRYLAAQKLGLETIPARVVNAVTQKDEILAIQLTENLQREDLNPIDQAKGILAYIQAKYPDKGYNLDGVINELMNYNLKPEKVSETMTETVSVISKIAGKSTRTMLNVISLLKLVPKIQEVISNGTLPVSQGYLFAANIGSPDFFTIFDEIMETPVTNAKLEKMLTAYKKAKPKSTSRPIPIKKKVAVLQNAKSYFEKKTGMYAKPELQTFLDELRVLVSFMEEQFQKAPATVPDNIATKKPSVSV
ncbi:MAG: ParB/RepB/Spo0J family partition protein [Proteobacteria bacterium]|nr:ParB/RepB/Spo0J family partition protein [Pseudomonadota bacterium]